VTFDWMDPRAARNRAREDENRRAMYRKEVTARAAMLRRLGYSAARATARLEANVDWEFEFGASRPADLDIGPLVAAAYK
jgi:hypothetical protein